MNRIIAWYPAQPLPAPLPPWTHLTQLALEFTSDPGVGTEGRGQHNNLLSDWLRVTAICLPVSLHSFYPLRPKLGVISFGPGHSSIQ